MITLLQINVDANNGSNGSIARDIGSIALSKGWNSYIAYGRRHIPCDSKLIRVGNNWDIKVHGLFTRFFDLHGLGSNITTRRLIRKIKQIKPDIIHLHNIHGYFINYRILFNYINKYGIPIVWTFHDCWPFTGHCAHYIGYNCYKWEKQCYDCPAKRDYPTSWLLDNSRYCYKLKKRLFTSPERVAIVTVSRWLQSVVKESFFKKYPISVIFDGIDTESFCYRPNTLKTELNISDKFVLMSAAANWSEEKGWSDYKQLAKLLPNNYVILLLGVSDSQKKELPNNILGISRVEDKVKLAEFYSMADILLNLSYAETFGMTTAEAMACGTPGISYDRTACPELISPDTGIVVEAGNMAQILNAISIIMRNGRSYYSKSCRQRILDNFDFKKVNQQYFAIYDEILKQQ